MVDALLRSHFRDFLVLEETNPVKYNKRRWGIGVNQFCVHYSKIPRNILNKVGWFIIHSYTNK